MRSYEFGDYRLNVESRKLFRLSGEVVPLTPRVFNLLLALVESGGRVLTKDELMAKVWADCIVEESNLSQSIFVLRKALGDESKNSHFIRTIPALGYRFIGEVKFENSNESVGANNLEVIEIPQINIEPPKTERIRRNLYFPQRRRVILAAAAAVLCLIFVSFALSAFTSFFSTAGRETETLQMVQLFTPETKPEGKVLHISFSPDGKFIVFSTLNDGINQIFVRSAAGGGLVAITDGKAEDNSPVWSPDGLRIAFVSNREGKTGIRTTSYLGGNSLFQMPLSPSEFARIRLVKWSNDEKRVFFESDGKLKTIELESGQISEIKTVEFAVAKDFKVSPDEKIFVFTVMENGKEQIWVQSLTGGEVRKLTDNNYRNLSPDWFPDSRRITFSSNRTGSFQIYSTYVTGKISIR